jgi:peroxiredoxin
MVGAVAAIFDNPALQGLHEPAHTLHSPDRSPPMTIQAGDRLPEVPLQRIRDGVETIDTASLFENRKVVLFAVPGAFTPTCSAKHLPGYLEKLGDFRARGVDVACLSVNDAFVMGAWARDQNVPADLRMLADGHGAFARALGLELDATAFGMGVRAKRFALYAEDGVVKQLHVEAPGEFRVAAADHVLASLPA